MPQPEKRARIFLVDDHPMIREHLHAVIAREADLEVCGEAEDAPTALARIQSTQPDLVIMDISLKNSHGLELLKDLKAVRPESRVLVLSMHDESLYAERTIRAGAMGYLTKQQATRDILLAIRRILAGDVYLSDHVSTRMMRQFVGIPSATAGPTQMLSDRELEVFQKIGQGLGTRRIAEELKVGIKTVESYRARIKEKLRLNDGDELLQHAIEWSKQDSAS